jgi:glycosyltransferase involved in cell wall biosynthesis
MSTEKGYLLRLEQPPVGIRFLSGGRRPLTISATNLTGVVWPNASGAKRIFIIAAWTGEGTSTSEDARPLPLAKPLGPGESASMSVSLQIPDSVGKHRLRLNLTTEDEQLKTQFVGDPAEMDIFVERPEDTVAGSIEPILFPEKGGVCGNKIEVPVRVVNQSETVWPSTGSDAVQLSYHWRNENRVVIWDGVRTSLPAPLAAGESVLIKMSIQMPDTPGTCQLQLTAECRQWGWFEHYKHCFASATFNVTCHDQQNVDEDLARKLDKWSREAESALERAKAVAWKDKREHLGQRDLIRIASQIQAWPVRPVFSVIMPVYNPPIRFLRDAIESVLGQLYPHWELCIADDASSDPEVREVLEEYRKRDPRIQVTYRDRNGHICAASNTALAMANGDYIVLLDHDDRLPAHALYCYAGEITRDPELQWLYSDMEIIDGNSHLVRLSFRQPPDKEYFRSRNYMGAHAVYRRDLVASLGGFRKGYEGSQDYDLGLRALEALPLDAICHVPLLLYQWRRFEGSASNGILTTKPYAVNATQRSLADHLARNGISGLIKPTRSLNYFEVRYLVAEPAPLVSIIIPTRDRVDLLRPCVHSLVGHTAYAAYEIVVADNESADPEARAFLRHLEETGIARVLSCPGEFNYSAIVNKAVDAARGEVICILNNDTEVIHEDWLSILAGLALQPDVGVVGPMLLYDNYTIQHAGVQFDDDFTPRHCFKGVSPFKWGMPQLVALPRAVPAVTGACQVMKKRIFPEVGGMDERHFKIGFGDIDFCLKVVEAGYRNVYTPFARLFHWESASRGYADDHGPDYVQERKRELAYLRHSWITRIQSIDSGNPHENMNGERKPSAQQNIRQTIKRYDHPVRPHLAFLHIPKTAGISFRDWVQSHVSERGVTILDGATNIGCYDDSERHVKRVQDALKRSQAIYSHFTFGLHEKIDRPLCYVTLLRDPVKRVWSAWNQVRESAQSPFHDVEADDIEPFIRKQLVAGNLMTRMLAGERPEPATLDEIVRGPCWYALNFIGFHFPAALWRDGIEAALQLPDAGPDNDPKLLERAMRNVDRFFFIGRMEALDQAAGALADALEWDPGMPIPHLNKGKGDGCGKDPGGQKRGLIEEYNQLDIKLYQYIAGRPEGYVLNHAKRDG